jgi:hypothetical protein
MQFFKKMICKFKGHKYEALTFMANGLYFCDRCGAEMLGRTFADLEPMTQEETDLLLDEEGW